MMLLEGLPGRNLKQVELSKNLYYKSSVLTGLRKHEALQNLMGNATLRKRSLLR